MSENPIKRAVAEWLPEIDFAVLRHGFSDHGRDYVFVLQAAATYELTLTHVVEMSYETRVADDVWPRSWDDNFTDYEAYLAAGEPDGYVWGTNWSLAFPGLEAPENDATASAWAQRLGHAMHAMVLETDRFQLRLVFHDARWVKLSDDRSLIDQVLTPLS